MKSLWRIYAILMYAYPREFRAQFGGEMQQVFRDRCQAVAQEGDFARLLRFLGVSLKDWLATSFRERFGMSGTGLERPPSSPEAGGNPAATGSIVPIGFRGSGAVRHPVVMWLLAVFIALFASTTMVRAYVIPTGSMERDLRIGDHVLVDKLHSKAGDIQRGDMIAFLYPEDTRQTYVKRVIGLPGDRIRLSGRQVIRNGRRLIEPYAEHVASSTDTYRDNFPNGAASYTTAGGRDMFAGHITNGEVVVPADSFFVLGDNRDNSFDSRYWGFVPRENVVGKPWIVYWSYDAPTEELAGWNRKYVADLAQHLFTKTRWSRTLLVLHSLPAQEEAP
jgi:signal peptidase I